ncbi:MAG: hypothetical protein HYU64_11335 [Armatimonadetes bacterium]|nr:hypothetical protein [Armatimonadota bacterium]
MGTISPLASFSSAAKPSLLQIGGSIPAQPHKDDEGLEKDAWLREGLHSGYEFVEAVGHSPGAAGIAGLGALASGIAWVGPTFQSLRDGIKNRDAELLVKGTSGLGVTVASFSDAILLAGEVAESRGGALGKLSEAIAPASPVFTAAAAIGQTLHGVVDAGFGIHEIVEGVKGKDRTKIIDGALEIGMGVGAAMIGVSFHPAIGASAQLLSYLAKTAHQVLRDRA